MPPKENDQDLARPTDYGLPTLSAKQALTPLDMNMPRLYGTRWILFFSTNQSIEKRKLYDELKAGLVHTMHEIPWMCGKVVAEQIPNTGEDRVEVDDGELGVRFKYNDLTTPDANFPSYEELRAAHFPLSQLSTAQLSPVGVMPQEGGSPTFITQANFVRGGLLLTICAHHSVCDAVGLHTIIQTWAQMSSSLHSGNSLNQVDPMVNDRNRLMAGTPGATVEDFPQYVLAPTSPAASTGVNSHQMAVTPFKLPDMTSRVFQITTLALERLKKMAAAYSTNDALQALVWRHVTLARAAASGYTSANAIPDGATALLYAANIRSKLSPPLPCQYTGNASLAGITRHLAFTEMTAPHGLVTAAAAIRSSVRELSTPGRVALTVGLIESRPNPTDFKFAYNGFLGPDLSSTSWRDLDVYQLEWGSLGKTEAFRVPGEGSDGAMMVLPRLPEGDLEFVVALESRAMECLMADKEFQAWVEEWA